MFRTLRKLVYPLLFPCGALLVTAAVLIEGTERSWLSHPLATLAPPLIAGLGALLAWRLNRSRLVLGLAVVFAADAALRHFAGGSTGHFTFAAIAVLLPLNLALFSLLPERGLITLRGATRLLLLGAQPAALWWLFQHHRTAILNWLEHLWVSYPVLDRVPLPQAGLAAFILAGVVLGLRYRTRPSALDAGFLWALAACFGGLLHRGSPAGTAYFAAAELILVTGLVETFHFLAFRDELTGLPARRALNEALAKVGGKYTLAMVDVDHFKKVNDRHGHDVGDQILKMMANRLAAVNGGGRAYRYGGEEFTILFPRKGLAEALPHLEQVREEIAGAPFRLRRFPRPRSKPEHPRRGGKAAKALHVTVSIGVAERGERNPTAAEVIKAADRALYRAKHGGRNQVRR